MGDNVSGDAGWHAFMRLERSNVFIRQSPAVHSNGHVRDRSVVAPSIDDRCEQPPPSRGIGAGGDREVCIREQPGHQHDGGADMLLRVPALTSFTHSETTARSRPATVWSGLQEADAWKAIGGIQQISDAQSSTTSQLSGFGFVSTVAGRPYRGTAQRRHRRSPARKWSSTCRHLGADSTADGGAETSPSDQARSLDVTMRLHSNRLSWHR